MNFRSAILLLIFCRAYATDKSNPKEINDDLLRYFGPETNNAEKGNEQEKCIGDLISFDDEPEQKFKNGKKEIFLLENLLLSEVRDAEEDSLFQEDHFNLEEMDGIATPLLDLIWGLRLGGNLRFDLDELQKSIADAVKNSNIDGRDNDGRTALRLSANTGPLSKVICEFLVRAGANVNARDNSGYTPLMLETILDHVDIVEFLLQNGADPSLKNIYSGKTALDYAKKYNHSPSKSRLEKLKCFLKYPINDAKITAKTNDSLRNCERKKNCAALLQTKGKQTAALVKDRPKKNIQPKLIDFQNKM